MENNNKKNIILKTGDVQFEEDEFLERFLMPNIYKTEEVYISIDLSMNENDCMDN